LTVEARRAWESVPFWWLRLLNISLREELRITAHWRAEGIAKKEHPPNSVRK
jgi:hypothetical protein